MSGSTILQALCAAGGRPTIGRGSWIAEGLLYAQMCADGLIEGTAITGLK